MDPALQKNNYTADAFACSGEDDMEKLHCFFSIKQRGELRDNSPEVFSGSVPVNRLLILPVFDEAVNAGIFAALVGCIRQAILFSQRSRYQFFDQDMIVFDVFFFDDLSGDDSDHANPPCFAA
jgi:hypothetical protein